MLEKMKAFLKDNDICVLATVSGSEPHCSLMAYVTDEDCREIYMATHRKTTKYANLKDNPAASLLMDTREEHGRARRSKAKALTVNGIFQPIEDPVKKQSARKKLLDRHPHLKVFMEDEDVDIFSIRVSSFLLLDGLTEAHFEKM